MNRHFSRAMGFLFAFYFLIVLHFNASAQSLAPEVQQKIDALFTKWDLPNSPGCAIGIVRNDSLVFAKGYGLANLEYEVPIAAQTIFHMASVSKQFCAYSIVLLEKAGKLRLDDDIHLYLPWFPDLKEKITIRHLLNHTSGIRDQWQLLAISGTRIDDVITQEHIVKVLQRQKALNFKPGEQYAYSNSGFTMLAEIVKSVSGQTLRQFADSAIFKPLGMKSTHFHDDYTEIVKNRAYSYSRKDSAQFSYETLSYSNAGATSLFTNVEDIAKWIMNLYNPKVGDQKDIARLTEKGALNNGKQLSYALGIAVSKYKGWTQYSHGGADAGYRTYVTAFPELKMGFIVLSNLGDFDTYGRTYDLADLFIKDKEPMVAKASFSADTSASMVSAADLAAMHASEGDYLSEDGVQFSYKMKDQKFYWERYGRSDVLRKIGKNEYVLAQDTTVHFAFQVGNKRDTILRQWWPDGERQLIKYTSVAALSDNQLQAYTGEYYSSELDVRYTIVLKDHQLLLTHPKYPDSKIRMLGADDLVTDYWWMAHLKILRNPQKKVTGFEVNDGRVMHLRFTKAGN